METQTHENEHQSLLKQALRLRLINELSTRLQGLLESEDFYGQLVKLVQDKFHYYSTSIWSVGSDGTATLRAQAGAYGAHLKLGHQLKDEGITGHVIATRKS